MVLTLAGAHATLAAPLAASGTDAGELQEIVVTATKRDERIDDVPMSISAISGEDLTRSQTLDLQDLSTQVAGLNIESGALPGGSRIILRGENSGGDGATVATLLDDFPISFSGANTDGGFIGSDFDTYDMQRVEVLRGPQGTLYGATAEGGLIKYVTNPPDPSGFHAGVEAGALDVAHGGAGESGKGFVNIPLVDGTTAFRASGFYERTPGWISDDLLGRTHANGSDKYEIRASLLWQPTQDLKVRLTALDQRLNASGPDYVDVVGGTGPNRWSLQNGYNLNTFIAYPIWSQLGVYGVNVDYDLHWARLQSITGFGQVHLVSFEDNTSLANVFSPSSVVRQRQRNDLHKYNQEFRLSSEPDSTLFDHRFDWQVGAYYTHESVTYDQAYDGLSYPSLTLLPGLNGRLYLGFTPSQYKEEAGYTDLTYHFTQQFDVDVGGRFSHNEEQNEVTESGLLGGGATPTVFPHVDTGESVSTYSVAARYHFTPDSMVYSRIASGYRPGAPNFPIAGAPPGLLPTAFKSDSTVNYEVGVKSLFLDKRVEVDVSAFYIDWTRIQITKIFYVLIGGMEQPYYQPANAGTAVSRGLEWNLGWSPVSGLKFGLIGAYTDAHLTEDAPAAGGVSGDQLPMVPKINAAVSFDYEVPVAADIKGFIGGNYAYSGVRYTEFSSAPTIDHLELPIYETLALQLGVRSDRYTAEIYGKNLTDSRAVNSYIPGAGLNGADWTSIIRPRTIGVRVSANF